MIFVYLREHERDEQAHKTNASRLPDKFIVLRLPCPVYLTVKCDLQIIRQPT